MLAPNPNASFVAQTTIAGATSHFDAGGSVNAGGSVTSYRWDFGDGTPAVTSTSPTADHFFSYPGTYTITLTTTNAGGCAEQAVYTGHMDTCSGLKTVTTKRSIILNRPAATPPANAFTTAASALGTHGATLKGNVDVQGEDIPWHFDYGTSSRYGASTPTQTLAARFAFLPVQAAVTGLAPDTVYHYRLAIQTFAGPVYGHDAVFRTANTGTLRLQSHTRRLSGHSITVPVKCSSSVTCRGTLTLEHGKTTCATGTFHVSANHATHKRLTLRSACRSMLTRHRSITTTLTGTLSTGQRKLRATVRLTR